MLSDAAAALRSVNTVSVDGDEEFARCAVPALTTIRVSAAAIGTHAAEMVLAMLAGDVPQRYDVPVKLVVRQSTGPVSG